MDDETNPQSIARTYDYERYLCSLFATAAWRKDIWAVLALGYELFRIPSLTSEPMTGLVRLKWWQEQLAQQATSHQHPVVQTMLPLMQQGIIPQEAISTLLDALAEQVSSTVKAQQVCGVMAAFYALLAYAMRESSQVSVYQRAGTQQGTIALIRSLAGKDGNFSRVEALLEFSPVIPPNDASPFLVKLCRLNQLWSQRILKAHKQGNSSMLSHLPLLQLRLFL